jgi:hypothetical protein
MVGGDESALAEVPPVPAPGLETCEWLQPTIIAIRRTGVAFRMGLSLFRRDAAQRLARVMCNSSESSGLGCASVNCQNVQTRNTSTVFEASSTVKNTTNGFRNSTRIESGLAALVGLLGQQSIYFFDGVIDLRSVGGLKP